MNIVLVVGLIIIFITTFFVLALGSSLAEESIACEELQDNPENVDCRIEKINMDVIVTFLMVVSFIIADVGAVYLMVTTWKSE
jgi:Na+/H+ antiporter NhaC